MSTYRRRDGHENLRAMIKAGQEQIMTMIKPSEEKMWAAVRAILSAQTVTRNLAMR
jgi:hypothetical protein